MLTLAVTAFVLFLPPPTQDGDQLPASAGLPGDRTLLAVEVVAPARVVQHAPLLTQTAFVLELQRARSFEWLSQSDPWFGALWANRAAGRELLESFDRGLTAGYVLVESGGSARLTLYVAGAAGEAKALARLPELVAGTLKNDAADVPLTSKSMPLAESPVQLSVFERGAGSGPWQILRRAATARRGRLAALGFDRSVVNTQEEGAEARQQRILDALGATLGGLIGVGQRSGGGDRLGPRPALADGQELVARASLRFRACARKELGFSDRDLADVQRCGLGGLEGAQSALWIEDGTPHDRVDIHYTPGESPAFALLQARQGGLADAAQRIPASALAAVVVGIDGPRLTTWCADLVAHELRLDASALRGLVRRLVGLPALPGGPDDKLESLTVFLLWPANGSLAPELCFLLPVVPRKGDVEDLLVAWSEAMTVGGRGVAPELKTLGTGDEAIRYLPIKEILAAEIGHGDAAVASLFLGGGTLAATRVGDSLLLGCNPRTVRAAKASILAGDVLAKQPGFRERLAAAGPRHVDGWFDFPTIVSRCSAVERLLPIFAGEMLRGLRNSSKTMPLPRMKDFALVVREERLWVEASPHGLALHVRGGTLLSPTAWAATVAAIEGLDSICCMMR